MKAPASFGTLLENNAKVLEIKEKLEELVKNHKQLYMFATRGDVKRKSRWAKEGGTKAKTRKVKEMTANIDNFLTNVLLLLQEFNSCIYKQRLNC